MIDHFVMIYGPVGKPVDVTPMRHFRWTTCMRENIERSNRHFGTDYDKV